MKCLTKPTIYGMRGHNFKDLTGNKYGLLTAIEFVGSSKSGTKWKLRCRCGKIVIRLASNFKKSQHVHSCGCIPNNPGQKDAGFKRLFKDYKASAVRRDISFNLTQKQFKNLSLSSCHYCGIGPSLRYKNQTVHAVLANGIDRVNSGLGYSVSNCVAACKKCNVAKNAMTPKEFLDWIRRVFYHNHVESKYVEN